VLTLNRLHRGVRRGEDAARGAGEARDAEPDRRIAIAEEHLRSRPELLDFWEAVQQVEAARREVRRRDFETWSRRAVDIAERGGEDELRILAYDSLGKFLVDRGERHDLAEAADLFGKSLAIKEGGRDVLEIARAHHTLAVVAYNRQDFDEAERHVRASHARNQHGSHPQGLEGDYRMLGAIARRRGRLDQAEEWLRRSLVISEDRDDRGAAAGTYAELGLTASDAGRGDEAAKWGRQALAAYEKLTNKPGMATAYDRLALIATRRDRLGEALMWMILSAALFGDFAHPATTASRVFLTKHVDLQGMAALEDDWREVTGTALPAPIRSYYETRAATRDNREAVAALHEQFEATAGLLSDMREFTLGDLRRAVQEYRATRQPPGSATAK
jgi:tetratricopeptide (TPR) repeat protein